MRIMIVSVVSIVIAIMIVMVTFVIIIGVVMLRVWRLVGVSMSIKWVLRQRPGDRLFPWLQSGGEGLSEKILV